MVSKLTMSDKCMYGLFVVGEGEIIKDPTFCNPPLPTRVLFLSKNSTHILQNAPDKYSEYASQWKRANQLPLKYLFLLPSVIGG